MKKIIHGIARVAMFVLSIGCVSAKPKSKVNKPELIDYQGSEMGTDLPKWVSAVANGDKKTIAKDLDLEDQKIFVFENRGTDLDFLKTWTEQVDIQSEVAGEFSMVVGQATQTALAAAKSNGEKESIQKSADMYGVTMKNVELNGLTKAAQFWTKSQQVKPGLKKAKSSADYNVYYTYYVVYSMDSGSYDKQMEAALSHVEDNTAEAKMLRKSISAKLEGVILPSTETEAAADNAAATSFSDNAAN